MTLKTVDAAKPHCEFDARVSLSAFTPKIWLSAARQALWRPMNAAALR
jgi:hypothetical protein